jgi:predicted O-methyltransferase YrrM
MSQKQWSAVDQYFADKLIPADPALDAVLGANAAAGLPPHDVSPTQGKFLYLLALIKGARHILEIGTLGGYSTIWLARALPQGGRLVTLEANPWHAEIASTNLKFAKVDAMVDLRIGPAIETLARLVAERWAPFDLIFIDADKPNNPNYLFWALKLAKPGTIIIGDNVVRDGAVVDGKSTDANVHGVREFMDMMGESPRLSATALQTVGSKGYDGFSLAVVR